MTRARRVGIVAARAIERVLGRRALVRLSRFLLDYARRDLPSQMETNGEWMVQDAALTWSSRPVLAVDVGANVGLWSRRFLQEARRCGVEARLFSLEPSAAAYRQLVASLLPEFEGSFVAHQLGASRESGSATLFKVREAAGTNSFHGWYGSTSGLVPETVSVCTLDEYCEREEIERVSLCKIDAEGHDAFVIEGAAQLLSEQRIDLLQFEYNTRWIGARRYLRDAFEMLLPSGYRLGKITPQAIEWYPKWTTELETFRESNFVAALPTFVDALPGLSWWKTS